MNAALLRISGEGEFENEWNKSLAANVGVRWLCAVSCVAVTACCCFCACLENDRVALIKSSGFCEEADDAVIAAAFETFDEYSRCRVEPRKSMRLQHCRQMEGEVILRAVLSL